MCPVQRVCRIGSEANPPPNLHSNKPPTKPNPAISRLSASPTPSNDTRHTNDTRGVRETYILADLGCYAAFYDIVSRQRRVVVAGGYGGSVMETANLPAIRALRSVWNRGRIVDPKRPLEPKHVWATRVRLELAENHRDLVLFNMVIDSKLRGCDLVRIQVVDVMASGQIKERASLL